MPTLLVAPPPTSGSALLGSIADIVLNRRRQEAAEQAQAESMAQRLLESQQQQQRFQDELALRQQQGQQQQAHLATADQLDAQRMQLERDKFNLLKADQEPVPFPAGAPSIPAVDAPQGSVKLNLDGTVNSGEGLLGKITDYGQSNDETPDSYTRAGKSAIGNLRPDSMAVSPDIEEKMRAQGIKIGTPITLKLDDGTTLTRFWDDRTAGEYNGKKLTQRFDLYSPKGPSPLRDRAVVGFSVADPSSPGKSLMESFERQPIAAVVDSPARERSSMAKQLVDSLNPNRTGSDILSGIQLEAARAGMNKGDYRTMMRSAVPQLIAAQARSQATPLIDLGNGNFASRSGSRVYRTGADGELEPVSTQKPNTLRGTYQDDSGRIYQQFADGTWDSEPPEGARITRVASASRQGNPIRDAATWSTQAAMQEKEARRIEKDLNETVKPVWPWTQNGKFFKMDSGKVKEIDDTEYRQMYDAAQKRKERIETLQANLDTTKRTAAELRSRADALANGQPQPSIPAAPSGPTLDRETAASILKETGGDAAKAREIARQRGFSI